MSVVVDVLLVLLGVVACVVALALLVPVSYRAVVALGEDDGISWYARVAWGFGFLSFTADGDGTALRWCGLVVRRRPWGSSEQRGERKRARPRKEKRPRRTRRARRRLRWLWSQRRTLAAIVGRYLRALHLRGRVEGIVGLPDPEQTAVVHQALVIAERVLPEGTLAIEVDWVDERVELEGRLSGWVWPLQVVGITLVVLIAPQTRRAIFSGSRDEVVTDGRASGSGGG